jgi:hypothetical protein
MVYVGESMEIVGHKYHRLMALVQQGQVEEAETLLRPHRARTTEQVIRALGLWGKRTAGKGYAGMAYSQ